MNKISRRAFLFQRVILIALLASAAYVVKANINHSTIKFASKDLLGGNLNEFPENTTWYRLSINGYALTTANMWKHENERDCFYLTSEEYTDTDADLWCIVNWQGTSKEFFYFLNKATGTKLFLSSAGSTTTPYPYLAPYDQNKSCFYINDYPQYPGKFVIKNYAGLSRGFLNRVHTPGTSSVAPYYLGHTANTVTSDYAITDESTQFQFTEVPVLTAKQKNQAEAYISSQNMVGGFPSDKVRDLETAYNEYKKDPRGAGKVERVIQLLTPLLSNTQDRIKFAPGFYRIRNARRIFNHQVARVIYTDYNGNIRWGLSDSTKVDKLWDVVRAGSTSSYTVMNPNTKSNITSPMGKLYAQGNLTMEELHQTDFPGHFKLSSNTEVVHAEGHNAEGAKSKDGRIISFEYSEGSADIFEYETSGGTLKKIDQASVWYLEPVKFINIEVKKRYSTFYFPFGVDVTLSRQYAEKGLYVYTPVKEYANVVKVRPVPETSYVKALTPAVFESEEVLKSGIAKTYSLNINRDLEVPAEAADNGHWYGTLTPSSQPAGIYVMKTGSKGSAFYITTSEGKVPANKVYLKTTLGAAGAKASWLELLVEDGTVTGIGRMETSAASGDAGEQKYYDLTGRRVSSPKRGVYINGNGRKIVFR